MVMCGLIYDTLIHTRAVKVVELMGSEYLPAYPTLDYAMLCNASQGAGNLYSGRRKT